MTFTAEGPKRTLVVLEHRDLERFGEAAVPTRGMMEQGWENTLSLYRGVAEQG